MKQQKTKGPAQELAETKRMSAAVKLQRAWDRERAKSSASNERDRMRRELQGIADRMKPKEEPKKDDQTLSEIKQRLDPKCWKGKHKEGTKIKGGIRVNNCVPNESHPGGDAGITSAGGYASGSKGWGANTARIAEVADEDMILTKLDELDDLKHELIELGKSDDPEDRNQYNIINKKYQQLKRQVEVMVGKMEESLGDEGHAGQENSMASSALKSLYKHAAKLRHAVKQMGDMKTLEPWQQAKITKAADYLDTVFNSVDDEMDMGEDGEVSSAGGGSPVGGSNSRPATARELDKERGWWESLEEKMMPRSNFAGVTEPPYHKLGSDAHLKGSMKRPARAGDLVGGGAEESVSRNEYSNVVEDTSELDRRLYELEAGLREAQTATRAIKYEPPSMSILVEMRTLVEKYKLNVKDFEYLANDVHEAQNHLESTIFKLTDVFKEAVRDVQYKIDDMQNDELDEVRRKGGGKSRGVEKNFGPVGEDLKPLTRSIARPGDPTSSTNPETGEKEFKGYKDYNPRDRGRSEKWAIVRDMERNHARLQAKKAAEKKTAKKLGGHKTSASAGFSTSSSGSFLGGGTPFRRGAEESVTNESYVDPYMEELKKRLGERVLEPNDTVEKYVDVFQKANYNQPGNYQFGKYNPQNRTPKKREHMAKAASYAAKTGKKK
jgi:hypothetical protein